MKKCFFSFFHLLFGCPTKGAMEGEYTFLCPNCFRGWDKEIIAAGPRVRRGRFPGVALGGPRTASHW